MTGVLIGIFAIGLPLFYFSASRRNSFASELSAGKSRALAYRESMAKFDGGTAAPRSSRYVRPDRPAPLRRRPAW
jgi:hypothetical protein